MILDGKKLCCRLAHLPVWASFCANNAAKQGMARELLAELQWHAAGIDEILLF